VVQAESLHHKKPWGIPINDPTTRSISFPELFLNYLLESAEKQGVMRKSWVLFSIVLPCGLLASGCDASARAGGTIALKEGVNHRVRPGESLFSIAQSAYRNGLEWPRIWEANPWLDPDLLRAGATVYIPPRDASWGDPPSRQAYALDPGSGSYESDEADAGGARQTSSDPGSGTPGLHVFRNLATNVSTKTFFGFPLEKVLLMALAVFLGHAIFQGVLVWLAANITFVKDASFKKSMKAVFLTESLTFSTLIVLVGVGILMLYLGTEPGGESGTQLFPALESYLRSPVGMGVGGVAVLALYIVLSLRFYPQVFGIPMSRAMTLMALAVLVPHLAGAYLVGQRTGLIK